MAGWVSDLRFGVRLLRRNAEVTLVAVLAMALAIGVAGTVFSVVNAILIQPLPFRQPERLVAIWQVDPANPSQWRPCAPGNYADWRRLSQSFEVTGAALNISKTLTSFDEAETPLMQMVSADYFTTLGVQPLLGRAFTPEEDRPGGRAVALLSYELWQRTFGGERAIIGRTTELDGVPYEIIGVMPADFDNPIFGLTDRPQVWIPLALAENGLDRRGNDHYVVARLANGVTLEQAAQEFTRLSATLKEQYPETNRNVTALVAPLKENIVRGVRPAVLLLLAAVLFVLLIASSNVAHLLLTRSVVREREFAVRRALGAGARRLLRQLVIESLLLMACCAVPGLLLTLWGTHSVGLLVPVGFNIPHFDFQVDGNVLLFTLLISLLPGLALGLIPALYARRVNLVAGLTGTARATGSPGSRRLQRFLVIAETALSLALLIGAGLMVQSFRNLQRLDQGFEPKNVLTFRVSTRGAAYKESERRQRFFKEIRDRLAVMPGVLAVGTAQFHPFYPQFGATTVQIEGQPLPEPGKEPRATSVHVSPDYFSALQISLLRGRLFDESDTLSTPPVIVISAKMARTLWSGEDPIGKRVKIKGSGEVYRQVVGVVGDVRTDQFPPDPQPTVFVPLEQDSAPPTVAYVLRTTNDPYAFVEAAKREVHAVDRAMPVYLVRSMAEIVSGMDWRTRFVMALLAIFSILSLLLAVTGIYAALSYVVSQRTREIGVRLAIGAERRDILKLVIAQGMRLTGIGILIGAVAAVGLTRLMASLLFGVSATDLVTFVMFALLLMLVALVACYLPARRATRVDPIIALRHE
ncbi:MAG TPA: ABC transporter permease [Blastocatellia bacterium]|nr:ABC transporter permease [Blastocatellia bacterium]